MDFENILRRETASALERELGDGPSSEAFAKKLTRRFIADGSPENAAMLAEALSALPRKRRGEIWNQVGA